MSLSGTPPAIATHKLPGSCRDTEAANNTICCAQMLKIAPDFLLPRHDDAAPD